jgi:hypothetical protein
MSEKVPPTVEVYEAIQVYAPRMALPVLEYANLAGAVDLHAPYDAARWEKYEETEGFHEEKAAFGLAKQYFIQTSLQAVQAATPASRELWARRYTEASKELYGEPEPDVAHDVLARQRNEIESYIGNPKVAPGSAEWLLGRYDGLGVPKEVLTVEALENTKAASAALGGVIKRCYGDALAVFDGEPDEEIEPPQIEELFNEAFKMLVSDDNKWQGWRAELTDGSNLQHRTAKPIIAVGRYRKPAKREDLKGLFGHEVLVHGLRWLNGASSGESLLDKGLHGYYDVEEGIAKLAEYGLSGKIPKGRGDRYGDIALALGTVTDRPLPRRELFILAAARDIIRMQAASTDEQAADGKKQLKRAQAVQ